MKTVEALNKLCDGTLSITYYHEGWLLSSYGINSLFLCKGPIGHIGGETFDECIEKAVQAAKEVAFNA